MPEAFVGGPIALVKDGDKIIIDSATRTINWLVDDEEQARRREEWEAFGKREYRVKRGVLYKYARDVAVSSIHFWPRISPDGARCSRRTWARTPTRRCSGYLEKAVAFQSICVNCVVEVYRVTREVLAAVSKYNMYVFENGRTAWRYVKER